MANDLLWAQIDEIITRIESSHDEPTPSYPDACPHTYVHGTIVSGPVCSACGTPIK